MAIVDSIEDLNIINDKHGFTEEKYFSETSMCKGIVGFTSNGALVNRGENIASGNFSVGSFHVVYCS